MTSSEEDLIVERDKVVVRRILRGTHKGEFMGAKPTGREISCGGVWIAYLREGKIAEQWVYFDAIGLLKQIDALPA